jgi:hypothetical protein
MKKTGYRIMILLVLLCMMSVWPFGLIQSEKICSSGDTEEYAHTRVLAAGSVIRQKFTAQESRLREVSFTFALGTVMYDDTSIEFELASVSGKVLVKKDFSAAQLKENPQCTVSVNKWIHKGKQYSFTLKVKGNRTSDIYLLETPLVQNFAPGNCGLLQNGQTLQGQSYAKYVYGRPLNGRNVIFIWAFIGTIGFSVAEIFANRKKEVPSILS